MESADVDSHTLRARIHGVRAFVWLIVIAIGVGAAVEGLHLRRWAFEISDPIRFIDDDGRGYYWGLLASGPEGYLNQYDKMDAEVPEWQDSLWVPWLDYSPLRLLVMCEWAKWQRAHHPPESDNWFDAWQRPYAFSAFVMNFNAILEGFSAICAFFLTRLWVIRGTPDENLGINQRHFLGVWQGVVAALSVWFSIDIIISAHVWFQWDSWIVPWYLCACLLASLDWWFLAGVAVAIGVNFKGQMFSITPIFVIWPLVQGRYRGAVRWIIGMAFGIAAITSGWLLSYIPPSDHLNAIHDTQASTAVMQYPNDLYAIARKFDIPAAIWIFEMLVAALAVPWLVRVLMPQKIAEPSASRWRNILYSQWTLPVAGGIFIVAITYWPWLLRQNRSGWYMGILCGIALALLALFVRRRDVPYLLAAVAAGGLFGCIPLFHGGTGWYDCGVHYGSIHWPYMVTGPASNMPAIFQLRFGWSQQNGDTAFTLPAIHRHWPNFVASTFGWPAIDTDVTSKMLFDTIYGILLVLSGIAIGLQARRRSRRILVAFVTPWIMFFLFPVQIQERYLLYGAAAAACCIGDSIGMALLGLMLTLFSAVMQTIRLLNWNTADLSTFGGNLSKAFPHIFSSDSGQTMLRYLEPLHPDIGWGVLVVGMIFLYMSLAPSQRGRKQPSYTSRMQAAVHDEAAVAAENPLVAATALALTE